MGKRGARVCMKCGKRSPARCQEVGLVFEQPIYSDHLRKKLIDICYRLSV